MKTIILKSGVEIPNIGLGTFDINLENMGDVVSEACNLGYKLFDSATGYQNHLQLSAALQSQKEKSALICTKFNNMDLIKHKTTENVINNILCEFASDRIDFLLIHNPKVEDFVTIFKELIQIKETGKIRSIGVSNFTIKHLNLLKDFIEHVDLNEIELHPFLTQVELVQYCKKYDIKIIAYRPFCYGSDGIFENTTLKEISENHNKTVSQIVLRWLTQQGHIAIPKSSNKSHLKSNIEIFDFLLTESEINKINSLNKGLRTCTGPWAEFED